MSNFRSHLKPVWAIPPCFHGIGRGDIGLVFKTKGVKQGVSGMAAARLYARNHCGGSDYSKLARGAPSTTSEKRIGVSADTSEMVESDVPYSKVAANMKIRKFLA